MAHQEREEPRMSLFLGLPRHLSLPSLPSHLAPQLFPDSRPLKGGRKAHFGLLLFSLILKESTELKIEVRMEFCFSRCYVLPSRTTAWMRACQGLLCQLPQALLSPWLPAQSWPLAFTLPREAHPKRCTLFFSCQSDQSPDLLLSRRSGHLGQRHKSSPRKTEWIGSSHLHPEKATSLGS